MSVNMAENLVEFILNDQFSQILTCKSDAIRDTTPRRVANNVLSSGINMANYPSQIVCMGGKPSFVNRRSASTANSQLLIHQNRLNSGEINRENGLELHPTKIRTCSTPEKDKAMRRFVKKISNARRSMETSSFLGTEVQRDTEVSMNELESTGDVSFC